MTERQLTERQPMDGRLTPTGVRRFGDNYQDLIAWHHAMELLPQDGDFNRMQVEAPDAKSVDDIVLHSNTRRSRYIQVKWTSTPAQPLNSRLLMGDGKGTSLLQKLYRSRRHLMRDDKCPPDIELVTNRSIDVNDPVLKHLDGRTDRGFPPAIRSDRAAQAKITEYAGHVGCDRDEIVALLMDLTIRCITVDTLERWTQDRMLGHGLRRDLDAVEQGVATIAAWVRAGKLDITRDDLNAELARRNLRRDIASSDHAVLEVRAIQDISVPSDATASLDFLGYFERRGTDRHPEPHTPADWVTMSDRIDEAAQRLISSGVGEVTLRGTMRQSMFFKVGNSLKQTTGIDIEYHHSDMDWSTAAPRTTTSFAVRAIDLSDEAGDLAVAVGISIDPSSDVMRYLSSSGPEVRALLSITTDEIHDQSIRDSSQAIALAASIRSEVRYYVTANDIDRVHLFLAGPGGLALLLGHRWNRVGPTVVYEHIHKSRYTRAFSID